MKLTKANVKQNRKFHELPEAERLEFLLKSYSEVFPTDDNQRGDFTPVGVDLSKLDKGSNRDERFAERDKLNSNIDRINFLMTRLNMTGNPQYEDQIRELALLRFEYMFMAGDDELTQDPKLVADFFRKRGKPELIRPIFSRMGAKATEYEHLAERIIDNPVFVEHVGEDKTEYRFRTRKGLNYNRWALMHEEHRKTINPVLAQDSYAMIIAGDILVGDLEDAVEDFNRLELQQYKNPEKIRAAVNLAWEMMQHPGESDEQENYQPPRGFLFHVAKEFSDFLRETPSAVPYVRLANATSETKLTDEEEMILGSVRSLDDVERIYTQLGRTDSIRDRFLTIFDEVYDQDTEHCILTSNVSGIVRTVQNLTFKKYVNDEQISERLGNAINRTLGRKSEYDPERDEFGTKKMVAAVYNNPVLRSYVESRVNVGDLVNGMIDDVVGRGRRDSLISEPLSLRGDHEIAMGASDTLEAYAIADACRTAADPERMTDLVAYIIGIVADQRYDSEFSLENRFMHMKAKIEGAELNEEAFPTGDEKRELNKYEFLTGIYQREKQLGGIDRQKVQTALTNVLFRANYAVPRRFYPHADAMMAILDSPLAEVLPTEGLGYDAIKEYKILHDFVRR